jgi:hypothetical protein
MSVRTGAVRLVAVAGLLAACVVFVQASPAAATACDASSQAVWATTGGGSCDVVKDAPPYVRQLVYYDSTDVPEQLGGQVCVPKSSGVHPIAVINHGGFEPHPGDDPSTPNVVEHPKAGGTGTDYDAPITDYQLVTQCEKYAEAGYYAVAPYYRRFLASNPDIGCDGEVDDVLGMIALAKTDPRADAHDIVMLGGSHGGCVTLRTYQHGVDGLVAAAAVNPLTDWVGEWTFLNQEVVLDEIDNLCLLWPLGITWHVNPNCGFWYSIKTNMETAAGGPMNASTQAEYDERSVDQDLPNLRQGVPLLIVEGADDPWLSPSINSCAAVAGVNALSGGPDFVGYHFTSASPATLTSGAVTGCSGFTWDTSTNPTSTGYPGDHYFFVYDGYPHFLPGPGGHSQSTYEEQIYNTARAFLTAKT